MNLHDFKALEKELGRTPMRDDVKEWEKRPRFKTAYVQFADTKYNYRTSVNGKQSDADIIAYFKNQMLNLGSVEDNMQLCVECSVEPSDIK